MRRTASATAQDVQPDLAGLDAAIRAMNAQCARQGRALGRLFAQAGYSLAAGDVLYHAPDVVLEVPPQYRAQVVRNKLLAPGQILYSKNPRFSLF